MSTICHVTLIEGIVILIENNKKKDYVPSMYECMLNLNVSNAHKTNRKSFQMFNEMFTQT